MLARACLHIGIAGLVLLVVAALVQVVGRYAFNNTPAWAESFALLMVLYVTMLGCAVGVRELTHLGLEIVVEQLPPKAQRVLFSLAHFATAAFGALMMWHCAELLLSVREFDIPTLGISEAWRYLPMVLAGALITLFSVEHMLARWQHQVGKT